MDSTHKTTRSISPFQNPIHSQKSCSSSKLSSWTPDKIDRLHLGLWRTTGNKLPSQSNFQTYSHNSNPYISQNKKSPFLPETSGTKSVYLQRKPQIGDYVGQNSFLKSKENYRFLGRFKEDRDNILKSNNKSQFQDKERKIEEEPRTSLKTQLSIKSNLDFSWDKKNANLTHKNRPFISSEKKENKILLNQLQYFGNKKQPKSRYVSDGPNILGKNKDSFGFSRKTKAIYQMPSRRGKKLNLQRIKGFKTIENFGGKGLFKLKNQKISSLKSQSNNRRSVSRNKTNQLKKKYRNKKEEFSSSSQEPIRGSSSLKAPQNPNHWYFKREMKYFSKKSQFFHSSTRNAVMSIREKEVVRMFRKGKKMTPEGSEAERNQSIMKRIREKCQKILSESKEAKKFGRTKIPKLRNLEKVQSIQAKRTTMSRQWKEPAQNPSIVSVDPLYIHAFVKKPKKRIKRKKGISFFMATFKSKRCKKKFFVFENESKVIKFRRGQKNKIIEHTADDDYDTDNEQMKLAVRQCKKDFLKALDKVTRTLQMRKRALSMISMRKKRSSSGRINEKLRHIEKINNKLREDAPVRSRRQTRKNVLKNFAKADSGTSLASTTVSSSYRNTAKGQKSKPRGRQMVKNEFFKAERCQRRAVSIMPGRGGKVSDMYQFFEKGCRKRNKMGF